MKSKPKSLDPGVERTPDANLAPYTVEAGSHPVGTGLGWAGDAAAAEALDPTAETNHWRETYKLRPYYREGRKYSDYEAAYRYGWESASLPYTRDLSFEEYEPKLARDWKIVRGEVRHEWAEMKDAARDAWDRVRGRSVKNPKHPEDLEA